MMTNDYELLRKKLEAALLVNGMDLDAIKLVSHNLDEIATAFSVQHTGTEVAIPGFKWMRAIKEYICSCGVEGMSNLTLKAKTYILKGFFEAVKKDLETVSTLDVRNWLYAISQDGVKDATRDNYRVNLNAFYTWCIKNRYVKWNPVEDINPIKCEKNEREYLTKEELDIVRASLQTPRERAFIEIAVSSGCRVSEMANLKREDVDMETGIVKLFGKGKKHRVSRLSERALSALKEYYASRDDECAYIFVTERLPHTQMSTRSLEILCEKIEARNMHSVHKRIHPHVLRHTFATLFHEAGGDLLTLQRLLGHEKTDTTSIYAKTGISMIMQEHERIVG